MANLCLTYAIAFCLVALALFHVLDCAETRISPSRVDKGYKEYAKEIAYDDVKISNGFKVEKLRKEDRCVIEAEFMWCCVSGHPNKQLCYHTKASCQAQCADQVRISTRRVDKGHKEYGKEITNDDVKISSECEVEKRTKGAGCVLGDGEFIWCCVLGYPNEQRCYDTKTKCQEQCNRLFSKTKLVKVAHHLNP